MKADLHIHSLHSENPSDWFLQRIGAADSYTKPKQIYMMAKERGMDLVTITDHNKIDGILKLMEKFPEDTFSGVEVSTYFPEDGCRIHILIWGFKEKQFAKIDKHRNNIYDLREYIREKNLAYAVAHPNYSVNGKLKASHIGKLILLFDHFEVLNGYRSAYNNQTIYELLKSLTPEHISQLYDKYHIEPFSDTPWIKGFVAGSNDSAALFIGKTYTEVQANSIEEYLEKIKNKESKIFGRSNNFASLAFTVYKTAWDYSESKSKKLSKNLLADVSELIFEPKTLSFINRLKLKGYHATIKKDDIVSQKIIELIEKLQRNIEQDVDKRIESVYYSISDVIDAIIIDIVKYFSENLKNLNVIEAFSKISGFLPALFLAAPFISSFHSLHKDRKVTSKLRKHLNIEENKNKKILWFTDTIDDLNGVSVSLKEFAKLSSALGGNVKIVSSTNEFTNKENLPKEFLELKSIISFKAPYYEKYILSVPSFLDSLKRIQEEEPDEIYISTPGFIGLMGLIAAKLLHIKSVGIFHTDFEKQLGMIVTHDDTLEEKIKLYARWFYSYVDEVAVPSKYYVQYILDYGIDPENIVHYMHWIDADLFKPINNADSIIREKHNLNHSPILLFTGRISRDKNLDLILEIAKELNNRNFPVNILLVGDGPYYKEIQEIAKNINNVHFTGALKREDLPVYYSGSDLLIFPSETDTFGMTVLEAQSCGLVSLVSKIGGPCEIIIEGVTGFSLDSDKNIWADKIIELIELNNNFPDKFEAMRNSSRQNVIEKYAYQNIIPNNVIQPL